jgi:predicted MFS family arabinose efflux permease
MRKALAIYAMICCTVAVTVLFYCASKFWFYWFPDKVIAIALAALISIGLGMAISIIKDFFGAID